jgi:hypothetical protein
LKEKTKNMGLDIALALRQWPTMRILFAHVKNIGKRGIVIVKCIKNKKKYIFLQKYLLFKKYICIFALKDEHSPRAAKAQVNLEPYGVQLVNPRFSGSNPEGGTNLSKK